LHFRACITPPVPVAAAATANAAVMQTPTITRRGHLTMLRQAAGNEYPQIATPLGCFRVTTDKDFACRRC
jgi:hypothetical protein